MAMLNNQMVYIPFYPDFFLVFAYCGDFLKWGIPKTTASMLKWSHLDDLAEPPFQCLHGLKTLVLGQVLVAWRFWPGRSCPPVSQADCWTGGTQSGHTFGGGVMLEVSTRSQSWNFCDWKKTGKTMVNLRYRVLTRHHMCIFSSCSNPLG